MMLPLPPKTTSIFRKFEGGEKNPHFFFVCVSLFVEKSIWGKKRSRRGGCTRRDTITGVDLPLKIAPSLLEGKAELGGGKYCLRRLALGGMKLGTIYEEIGKRNFPRVFSPSFSPPLVFLPAEPAGHRTARVVVAVVGEQFVTE